LPSRLGRVHAKRRTGDDKFQEGKTELPYNLLSLWQWSFSDVLSNATRGVLAEYIIARALGLGEKDV